MFVHAAILAKIPAGRTVHAFRLVSCQGLKVIKGYDEHSYMIDHASDGQSLKCGRIRRRFGKFSTFTSLDSGIRLGAFLALRVLSELHLISEVYLHNYCQPAM